MKLRSVAIALALAGFAGCKPELRGRCTTSRDCRQGSYCAVEGICLASSGTCVPACGAGAICSGSVCAALKPVVSVVAPPLPISPAFSQITVHVEAAAGIALRGVTVEVDSSLKPVVSGSLDAPLAGDNLVTLKSFAPDAVGHVSVRATLRYRLPGALEDESISSVAVPATIDDVPPTVAVFIPTASDAVNGWVPRTAGTLEVQATVDDGAAGSGAQAATLSFDTCPAAVACTYAGTVTTQSGSATVFSFAVPRFAQAAGSEAPLAVTVKAHDVAGNEAQAAGTVQIDDAPPQIGALGLVSTTGVVGEDGKTWFIGGPASASLPLGAPAVKVVFPVSDAGSGFASLALHLDKNDLYSGFPSGSLDVTGSVASDGIQFLIPANGVHGKEQHLRFTLTAKDQLKHVTTLGPDDANTMIWVDAVPPVIVNGPHVIYSGATPPSVCGPADSNNFKCGRQNATRLLPDDSVTVTYDAYDCGVGLGPAQDATASTGAGGPNSIATADKSRSGMACSNGSANQTHHYSFTLSVAAQAPVLDPPIDLNGTSLVRLAAKAQDRLLQASQSAPNSGTTGDGLALISLWRWRNQVAGVVAPPSGAPALLPGTAGARRVAVGTTLGSSSPNFFVVGPDGTPAWNATVTATPITGDIAVGPSGRVYLVGPPAPTCSSSCSGTLTILLAPPSGGGPSIVHACAPTSNVSFGSPPAIVANPERAVLASIDNTVAATSNIFLFEDNAGCQADAPAQVPLGTGGKYLGLSANWPTIFLATGQGFTSIDRNSGNTDFDAATQRAYNSTATVPTVSPPAISTQSSLRAIFASVTNDKMVHSAKQATCTSVSCWVDDSSFSSAQAGNSVPFTPVFDAAGVYIADNAGVLYAFPRSSGGPNWSQDFIQPSPPLPAPWPTLASGTTSPPVLLPNQTLLAVRSDGVVALATAAGFAPLLKTAGPMVPVAPVIDSRPAGGVAYVVDGDGWLTAVQLPVAPLAAGSNIWPRPARDSCNSRNAASSCQ